MWPDCAEKIWDSMVRQARLWIRFYGRSGFLVPLRGSYWSVTKLFGSLNSFTETMSFRQFALCRFSPMSCLGPKPHSWSKSSELPGFGRTNREPDLLGSPSAMFSLGSKSQIKAPSSTQVYAKQRIHLANHHKLSKKVLNPGTCKWLLAPTQRKRKNREEEETVNHGTPNYYNFFLLWGSRSNWNQTIGSPVSLILG